ncbi:MAG: HU family DNA-binding protein [Candidatus Eiseniibacteriota bacterium]|nr:MAG: HU family DNA-binding protein [Candidatus Eisenbacteria bacterium]
MSKSKLAVRLAKKTGLSLRNSRAAIEALFSTQPGRGIIVSELLKRNKVQITGFGTFETRRRKARDGRNPQTGEKIKIAATRFPAFQAGKALKDRVKA